MILRLATLLAALCVATVSHADSLPKPGDYYLISRDHAGKFIGSHKLFKNESADTKRVSYCGNEYFVRDSSVAWTELEAEFGHIVHVEFNFGKGWRPICANPEREVTLADLGITMDAREVLAGLSTAPSTASRLATIGAMFRTSVFEKSESGLGM
ncbi:hypothetical protein [Roseibium sp. MMSF_3412]|uniref:hypothetical protein n=1 Tax=Roseibium sp. MMSF_3412 TaxID=3046712 RepID=UPI00273E457E|nr:hypothetical protein [Roseibium sp. MMSF_3412]